MAKRNRKPLEGVKALVTSGPTHEPLDAVRFLGNRSSGKQGHAIAAALAAAGAKVTLVTGPVSIADPAGVVTARVTTAREMLAACKKALPVELAVCAAAVADWRPAKVSKQKIKKNGAPPAITLVENPDILKTLSRKGAKRPKLVVGFAAETEKLEANAKAKLARKGCDWLVANDVSGGKGFDAEENTVLLFRQSSVETWPRMSKQRVAERLVEHIINHTIKHGEAL
jgi:phosphopantothenoylcysteine decarboxylase / phosphopantothenate---cysteine ligase